MARRKISSAALEGLGALASFGSPLTQMRNRQQMDDELADLQGVGDLAPEPEEVAVPQIPSNPDLYPLQGEDVKPLDMGMSPQEARMRGMLPDPFEGLQERLAQQGAPALDVEEDNALPQGIELLGDVAEAEAQEDELDRFAETQPPGGNVKPLDMGMTSVEARDAGLLEDPFAGLQGLAQESTELPLDGQMQVEPGVDMGEEPTLPEAVEMALDKEPVSEVQDEDLPQEGLGPVNGAVEMVQANPELMRNLEVLARNQGIQLDDETMRQAKAVQDALTKQKSELDELSQQYRQKLETGTMSTMDNVALGIAIMIPVIAALTMGKEAFLSSLGGAAKGFLEAQGAEANGRKEIQKNLEDIGEKRGKITEAEQKLLSDVQNKEIAPGLRKLFASRDVMNSGPNGEIQLGSDMIRAGDKLGLSARDDEKILYYDTNLLQDEKDLETFRKNEEEGREAVKKLSETENNVSRIMEVMEAIKDQHPNIYTAMLSNVGGAIGDLGKIKVTIMDRNGNQKEVDALPLLSQEIGTFMDTYRTGFLPGTRFSGHFQEHWNNVFGDISNPKEFLNQNYDTMLEKTGRFRQLIVDRIINDLSGRGFLKEPMQERYSKERGRAVPKGQITSQVNQQLIENPGSVEVR